MILRGTMALQTPGHAQRLYLVNPFHLVNPTVTAITGNPRRNVSTMIKIDVVREIMDLNPLDRLIIHVAVFQLQDIGALGLDLTMAIHTGIRTWNI